MRAVEPSLPGLGEAMISDHRRILATAIGRLRAKIKYRPVVFELAPDLFHAAASAASGRSHRRA